MICADQDEEVFDIEAISTNCDTIDYVLGCGGIPRGRIIEVFGEESSGKSTMAAYIVAQVQKQGGKALWVDAEFSFSKDYYKDIGVKFDSSLLITQPGHGEEALDIVIRAVKTGELDIIVVDSVSSLVPKDELEGAIDKASVALQARMMSKALRMLTGSVAESKTVVIFINQVRDKIGVFFGNKTATSGGKALNFYASIRLEVRKGKKLLGKNEEVIGNEVYLCAVKNKVAPPFRKGKVELIYAHGVDLYSDWLQVGVDTGIIKRSGSVYSYNGEPLATGKDHTKIFLQVNPRVLEKIKKEIYDKREKIAIEKKEADRKETTPVKDEPEKDAPRTKAKK
jgi:recombination protein RecA